MLRNVSRAIVRQEVVRQQSAITRHCSRSALRLGTLRFERLSCGLAISATLLSGCVGADADDKDGTKVPVAKVGITSQGAALTVQQNVDTALRGVLRAAAFVTESQALASSLSSLGGSDETCVTTSSGIPTCTTDETGTTTCADEVTTTTCTSSDTSVTTTDLAESHQEMVDALDEFMTFLHDEIFIDANLESDDGMVVIYKLPSSLFCSSETSSGSSEPIPAGDPAPEPEPEPEPETAEPDPECLANYDKLQPRLRLSSPKEGDIDVGVLLTADKTHPITLQLYSDRIGLEMDLGEFKKTLDAVGEDTGNLQDLDGVVRSELIRNDDDDYSLRASVIEDVHVVAGEPGETVSVVLSESSPTTELRLDGAARTITGTVNYGALNVVAPLSQFADEETYDENGNLVVRTYTGDIDFVLGGVNGTLTFDGNTDVLEFKDIGLGDTSTSIKYEGDTIFNLDVNRDDGRRFDLSVANAGDESATLTFSPTLDIRVLLDFAKLASQIPDIAPALLNDDLHIWFDGANPSVNVSEGSLQVVSGTLHMESGQHPETSLTVDPGMCLVEVAETEAEPVSFASAFTAGVCE